MPEKAAFFHFYSAFCFIPREISGLGVMTGRQRPERRLSLGRAVGKKRRGSGGDRSDLAVTREELGNTAIKDVAVLHRDLGKVLIVYVRSSLSLSFPNFSCIFVRQGSPQAQRCRHDRAALRYS